MSLSSANAPTSRQIRGQAKAPAPPEMTCWQILQPVQGMIRWAMVLAGLSAALGLVPLVLIPTLVFAVAPLPGQAAMDSPGGLWAIAAIATSAA